MTLTADAGRPRNLLFLSTPTLWVQWPFLPLVRRQPDSEPELGVLYDAWRHCGQTGFSAAVILGNLFLLPQTSDKLLAMPREVYDSAEEIYAAGWRVD